MKFSTITLLAVLGVAGCQNTADGMKKDAEINSENASEHTQNIQSGAKEAGEDMGAATILTPKIKTAITADKRLNDSKNLIDVDSTAERVTLSGHVTSAELKKLASEIANKVMAENAARQTLDNRLEVK